MDNLDTRHKLAKQQIELTPAIVWSLYFSLLLLPTEYQKQKWIYFKDIPDQMQRL